ncbi:MAG: hypothetical protein R3182_09780, partial [Draconibacterium sp.]|nr:hypothetical protein [Draconibacterium sp.]
QGLSSTDGQNWITYTKNENSVNGKATISNETSKKDLALSPSIAHNFINGVDVDNNIIWVATSKGVCRGELIK